MRDYLEDFRKVAIYSVIVMIAFVTVLTIIGLIISFYYILFAQDIDLENRQDSLTIIGNFLVVVIAVELLDTLILYVRKNKLFPELILLVVLTAVGREVLVTDLAHVDPLLLIGVGVVLVAVAGSYYLVKRAAWEAKERGEES
jgi:uncharacterized membrane protein (DUF373 family)